MGGDEFGDIPGRRILGRTTSKKKVVRDSKSSSFYDIRSKYGISYASVNRNQNNPNYCESSWAHAAASALNDRFALLKNASHPEVVVSVQVCHLSCDLSVSLAIRFC